MIWPCNQLLNGLFDIVMWPCRHTSPWPGLMVTSLLTSAVIVILFRFSSDQTAIRHARNRFLARSLELLMFQHDLRVSLTACGRILAANISYLGLFLRPMAIGLIPILLIFVQLESWFDRRPLLVGERTILTIELAAEHSVISTPVELRLSETLQVDSPVVRIPLKNQLSWRVAATAPGSGWADVRVAGIVERKLMMSGSQISRLSPQRERAGFVRELFSPSEPPLPNDLPIRSMQVSYPRREVTVGLTEIPWTAAAVLLIMIFSLLLGRLLGIDIA